MQGRQDDEPPTSYDTGTTAPSSFEFYMENGSLHPLAGAGLTPLPSGVAEGLFGRM